MTELDADKCLIITAAGGSKCFSRFHFMNDMSCRNLLSKPEMLSLMCLIAAVHPLIHPSVRLTIIPVTVFTVCYYSLLVCSHSLPFTDMNPAVSAGEKGRGDQTGALISLPHPLCSTCHLPSLCHHGNHHTRQQHCV